MSLFDEIQARLRASAPAAPTGSAQDAALAAFQAKTGKAQTGNAGPKASNVGEQVARGAVGAQAAVQRAQVGQAADAQVQQRAESQEQVEQAKKDLAAQGQAFTIGQQAQAANAAGQRETAAQVAAVQGGAKEAATTAKMAHDFKGAVTQLAADRKVTADDIFETFRQGTQDLAYRKDGLDLEKTAQKMALADTQYVDKIKQIGTMQRLDNELAFKEEATRLAMGADWDRLVSQAKSNIDLNANDRAFNEQIAGMDSDFALGILTSGMSAANRAMIVKGVGDAAVQGGNYYEKHKNDAPETPTVEEAG